MLSAVTAETAQGSGVGVIAGSPAVQLTLRLTNTTDRPLALDSAVVNLDVGRDKSPASLVSGSTPFAGQLSPGATATAVYLFSLPATARGDSLVSVSVGAGFPTAALPLTV